MALDRGVKKLQIKKITRYILRKSIRLFSILLAVSICSFLAVSYSPIDPVQSYIGADMTQLGPEQREKIAEYWGLNEPKIKQFIKWGSRVLTGDLGISLIYRAPVSQIIWERFMLSAVLLFLSWIFSGLFGFALGILAGIKQHSWIDQIVKGYCFLLASTPVFWFGLIMLIVFSVWLGWLPIGLGTPLGILTEDVTFFDRLKHLFLPALTLSITGLGNVALHTRQKVVEVNELEFIRYAKAKGEKGFVLLRRHGLRNIILPAVSLHFASFGELFGGTVIVEQIFSYPGLGRTIVQAGLGGDVPLLMGFVLFSTIFVFIGNLIAGVIYDVVDPRLRKESFG